MTVQEFDALPLEARRFIEAHAGCLSCGNANAKLTRAYELYLKQRLMNPYRIKGGGVNFLTEEGEKGVLYHVKAEDSAFEIREKLRFAEILHEKAPQYFLEYNETVIAELLGSLPEVEIDLSAPSTEWIYRSEALGIDTKTAAYQELKDFFQSRGLEPISLKKADIIAAIDAIDIALD